MGPGPPRHEMSNDSRSQSDRSWKRTLGRTLLFFLLALVVVVIAVWWAGRSAPLPFEYEGFD